MQSKASQFIFGLLIFLISVASRAAVPEPELQNKIADPCVGSILSIFRRPTVITSACTPPPGKYTFESGLQYLEMTNQTEGWILPQSKLRIGLQGRNEFTVVFPNENNNSKFASGLSATQLSFKHNIAYNENWNTAVRVIYIPSSGSRLYGTAHNGYTLNGILAYRYRNFNASVMPGYSSFSTASANGGKRYNTWSPDAIVGWQAKQWLQLYAEVYGQLRTSPTQGPGYNLNTGLLFLFTKNIEADVEVVHRLSGHLGNFNVYYGTGFSFLF